MLLLGPTTKPNLTYIDRDAGNASERVLQVMMRTYWQKQLEADSSPIMQQPKVVWSIALPL